MRRRFQQIDVFTDVPYRGNPLAVVVDADGLSDAEMARFANWTNLSETTFLLPPTDPAADYRVRIFTTSQELPFAGHPTLGSCHAWLACGGAPKRDGVIVQQCGVGLVEVRRDDRLRFAAPPLLRSGAVDAATVDEAAAQLRIELDDIVACEWIDNGPGWLGVVLRDADAVLALRPQPTGTLKVAAVGPHPAGREHAIEVRAFFAADGVMFEDPVTGSANASIAQWLLGTGRVSAPYTARQGTVLGRAGDVHVTQDLDGTIWVGGGTVTCIDGTVEL